ncbi:MAG: hypothetical protein IPI46_01110 [Bacteroidetes bacterium]|nr:hypothetical protein [Bacteroidota bacterium]
MKPVLHNQGKTNNLLIVDTLHVLVHSKNYPYETLHSYQAILSTNGILNCTIKSMDGKYFISIKTRRGIETWTSHPIKLNKKHVKYNFTRSSSQAYGKNMIQVEYGKWAFLSGDVNQDGFIDFFDFTLIDKSYMDFIFGFNRSDINGDGNVDLYDKIFIEKFLDLNQDQIVDQLDEKILIKNPHLSIHVKRPMN